ncbi:hypothetical protein P389DRAFT_193045 [Cystobasidium minutum MCA 4210]|uniref:uncharacterized protein n=1 Tax=Cystobasidium minutum MCA 4210 TaxID=1397322 RepID=UPI0034CD635F|eukprot:jgi/Rhomi1/193045/gm1.1259_g
MPTIIEGWSQDTANHVVSARQNGISSITEMPDYALTHAPVMYLHSEEEWFPTDVKTFLTNVLPYDSSRVSLSTVSPTFASLSSYSTANTYLSSISDITTLSDPSWLNNADGRPDAVNASSTAPVEIIVAPKEDGILDVFYFFFFAYNHGTEVLGTSFGNHLGDWEHTMIRFQDGNPIAIYLSQHNSGTAYEWDAIMKMPDGNRPTIYVGLGDHACYAMPGTQVYDDFLTDQTDAGTMWDISSNYRGYLFDSSNGQFTFLNSSSTPSSAGSVSNNDQSSTGEAGEVEDEIAEGTSWLTFTGYWGDKQFDEDDSRQFCVFGHCRYTDGPLGPYLKNLGRKEVCQDEDDCELRRTL